jgi:DNA polymerase-3 subunit epsilon
VTAPPWYTAALVAIDLEGSGAQDRDHEAILEIAAVPLRDGHPDLPHAFTTLVNPERPTPPRPWISPGINHQTLRTAPPLRQNAATLTALLDGRWIVGHNVTVDWRLLHRHLPALTPAGLIDTLTLARLCDIPGSKALTALIHHPGLDDLMRTTTPTSQPHRALWDATAAANLLVHLIQHRWPGRPPTLDMLRTAAGIDTGPPAAEQPSLF